MEETNLSMAQGTAEWLAWRRDKKIGSSDCPIILGISPWQTPHGLWMKKTGRVEDVQLASRPIQLGNKYEPVARARYELKTGFELPPTIKVHPRYRFLIASLDGYSEEQQIILEIKCVTGRKTYEEAKAGRVVDHYYAQIQHQLLCANAKEAHFFVLLIEVNRGVETIVDDVLVVVKPDEKYQQEMLPKLLEFYSHMQDDTPPALTDRDYLEAEDQNSVMLFSKIKRVKQEMRRKEQLIAKLEDEVLALQTELEDLKAEAIPLVESLGHPKVSSLGVKMIKTKLGHWQVRLADEAEGE